jgi:hypothetical protein
MKPYILLLSQLSPLIYQLDLCLFFLHVLTIYICKNGDILSKDKLAEEFKPLVINISNRISNK